MEIEDTGWLERMDQYIEDHPLLCRIYCYIVYEHPNTLILAFMICLFISALVLAALIYYEVLP